VNGDPRWYRAWFNPERWSQYDIIIAICALALAASPFVPWYKATVRIKDSAITGFVMDPPAPKSGLVVHHYLWAVFALGLLEFAVLAVPSGWARSALRAARSCAAAGPQWVLHDHGTWSVIFTDQVP
jgi:hypothetical protein